jgi:putative heme-binding domain-containing protein
VAGFLADVRFAVAEQAANELVRRGTTKIYTSRSDADIDTHRMKSLWVLARVGNEAACEEVRSMLVANEPVRATALRVTSLLRDKAALPDLVKELGTPKSARTQRLAAEALGRIGDPTAVPAILEALKGAKDDIVAHALTYALIEIASPAVTAKGLQVNDPKVQRAAIMALGQMPDGALRSDQVTRFLTAKDSSLREAAAWVCGRHPEWGESLAGYYRQQIKAEKPVFDMPEDFQRQLAGFAGSAKIQDLMAETVGNRQADMEVRCVVLQAMSDSRLKQAPQCWVDALTAILSRSDEKLAAEVIRSAKSLPIKAEQAVELTPKLLDVASDSAMNAELRLTALAMIPGGLKQPSAAVFEFLAEQARPEQPVSSRATAADILAKARLSREQLLAVAEMLRTATPVELERMLAAVCQSTDKELGLKAIQALGESTALRSLRADALKTTLKKFGPDVAAPAAELIAKLEAATAEQSAKINELLDSVKDGDIRRGQVIFNSRKAVCVACHAIGYVGGKVGPDLTRIGQIRSERDLLEAIVLPSASFVRSYEPIQVVTTSGKVFNGLIRTETAAAITLVTGPDQEVRIARDEVEETHPGTVSVMPAGLEQQLTRQELADLVTFLKACK